MKKWLRNSLFCLDTDLFECYKADWCIWLHMYFLDCKNHNYHLHLLLKGLIYYRYPLLVEARLTAQANPFQKDCFGSGKCTWHLLMISAILKAYNQDSISYQLC